MSHWIQDQYPTEECLEHLSSCSSSEALEILSENWWPFDGSGVTSRLRPNEADTIGLTEGREYLRFSTGGWSGNEDMIDAVLRNNQVAFRWVLSSAGGLHIFEGLPNL